jgi:hypothetical protein
MRLAGGQLVHELSEALGLAPSRTACRRAAYAVTEREAADRPGRLVASGNAGGALPLGQLAAGEGRRMTAFYSERNLAPHGRAGVHGMTLATEFEKD